MTAEAIEQRDFELIVVGAGLTGLIAAYQAREAGVSVCVLEARGRVGGRTHTDRKSYKNGTKNSAFDLGARFIGRHPHQLHLWNLVRELELELVPQYQGPGKDDGDTNLWAGLGANLLRNGAGPEAYIGPVIPKTPADQMYLKHLKGLVDRFPVHDPRLMDDALGYDKLSVQDWVDQVNLPASGAPSPDFKALMRMLCRVGFSQEPRSISMLWFLFYIASSGGIERFQSVRWPVNGSQGYRLKEGAQGIAEALVAKLGSTPIHFHHQVTDVDATGKRIVVTTNNGRFTADKVLIALSPALYRNRITFKPGLPEGRSEAAKAMTTPPMVLSYVTFDTPFWRKDRERYTDAFPKGRVNGVEVDGIAHYGLSGDVLLADGPVVWIMDATSGAEQPALFAFIVGESVGPLETKADRERAVLEEMYKVFGQDVVRRNGPQYDETNWLDEPFTGGGPTAHFEAGGAFYHFGRDILLAGNSSPHEGIYFASTESSMVSNGYMAGAVWSGQEVAADIVASLLPDKVAAPTLAREQAMRWCIQRILRAIQEQDPFLESEACSADVIFHGPGGQVIPKGPYPGMQGAYMFYSLLASRITLTNVSIESIAVDVANDMGYATFTVDGILHGVVEDDPNANGNPFRDIQATMAFKFSPAGAKDVKVVEDWLFMNVEAIDQMATEAVGPFSSLADGKGKLARDALTVLARNVAELKVNAIDPRLFFLIYGPDSMVPGGQLVGPEGLRTMANKRLKDGVVGRTESETLDPTSMTYYAWQTVGNKRVLVTVLFKDSHAPVIAEVHFQPERDA